MILLPGSSEKYQKHTELWFQSLPMVTSPDDVIVVLMVELHGAVTELAKKHDNPVRMNNINIEVPSTVY